MTILGITYTPQEIRESQLVKDMTAKKKHLCKLIMDEVYRFITANPRKVTLRLYLQYNYPQYDNDTDCQLIWDLSTMPADYVSSIVFNV